MRRAENASPMRAAEEPPNQVFPNQRERLKVVKEPFYCLRMHLVPLSKLWDFGQLIVEESEITFARIKIDFVVKKPQMI